MKALGAILVALLVILAVAVHLTPSAQCTHWEDGSISCGQLVECPEGSLCDS